MTIRETGQRHSLRTDVDNFLNEWHSGFVLDYWWRHKHGVAFGSESHRAMSFIDMYVEYREDKRIAALHEQRERERYGGGMAMSQKEIDEDYENLNLEDFNG